MIHLPHIYRETNSIADGLTKRGRMQASFLETFTNCPFLCSVNMYETFCISGLHVSAL